MDLNSSVESVLAQMRALQKQATALPPLHDLQNLDRVPGTGAAQPGFSELLGNALSSVNTLQQESSALANGLVTGTHQDLVRTMIAGQKSSLAFQALVTTRNRMVTAYQDIMNMPI